MAKPLNAIEMAVAHDLSETAILNAHDVMLEAKADGGDFGSSSDKEFFSSHKCLRVASQNMGAATVLRLHSDFYIDISFTYSEDEWSLHEKTWNKKTKQYDEIIVWSPGA